MDLNDFINPIYNFLESSEIIGILVGQSGENQLHCGIVYKFDEKFNAIHLAWHYLLRNEICPTENLENYVWVKSNIHETRQNSIAAMCRRILRRQNEKKIPYGLLYTGGCFTTDGVLSLSTEENGLTCATFVMAVFNSCGIQLIDIQSWDLRESDSDWHNSIIATLMDTKERFGISDIHIENVSKELGCARFRPEEVAVSSTFEQTPALSVDIVKEGAKLRNIILA